ncbi:MAG TPA: type II toxin-antitoxin system Phd/YefM family antitoxin [Candidatus Angelobacter sp.]|jgi:prevent-host-death family protein|nr:type II toxin-antitoxin system Phd/YefM family antitoxin [Candidatus Angelobacter sp.]
MEEIAAGKFKARCLSIVDQVKRTRQPVLITKHGKPVAKLVPADLPGDDIFGYMADKVKIVGDIVTPITPMEDWERKCPE